MKVVVIKCPKCSQPIYSKVKDTVFFCDKCNTLHARNGGVQVLDHEIAEPKPSIIGEKVYLPFWRVWAEFTINHINSAGGTLNKLSQFFRGATNSGSLFVFVPANEMDVYTFKQMSVEMTFRPPQYSTRLDFSTLPREPAKIDRAEAEQMADFVFVTMQADQPGVLQQLDYALNVKDAKMVYLPFVRSEKGLTPAW
jgi:hypothetical protein